MIRETGRVIKAEQGHIWVETSVKSTCSSCAAKANCGTSAIADAVAGKTLVNKVRNELNAKVGNRVEIGIPEETLVSGAFLIYLLPLFTALASALACQFWLQKFVLVSEAGIILATLLGGVAGFGFARWRLGRTQAASLHPKLLRVLPESLVETSDPTSLT